jgi:hypothetical protein
MVVVVVPMLVPLRKLRSLSFVLRFKLELERNEGEFGDREEEGGSGNDGDRELLVVDSSRA